MATNKAVQTLINNNAERIAKELSQKMGPGLGQLSEITPNIMICNAKQAARISELADNKIGAVYAINIPKTATSDRDYTMYKIIGIHTKAPNFGVSYELIHKWILDGRRVLVCCQTGTLESVAIVAHYLLRRYYLLRPFCIEKKPLSSLKFESNASEPEPESELSTEQESDDWEDDPEDSPELREYKKEKRDQIIAERNMNKPLITERILELIQNGRPCIAPNISMIRSLIKIELEIRA